METQDYLNVLKVLKGTNFVYFTSDKSSLVELCEWMEENLELKSPFTGAGKELQTNTLNKEFAYTDIMLYRFVA